ncbi:site-specific integrase [Tannerella serpentiformis]|uniref:site-specific integrase n=1 Tax=Tannerella serpentiformis TaxID=712710 RepID=UPI000840ED31|nr:site-specific integrase [Tannerella serpentiformis]AOH39908.1 site-specific integrase [Tannerella serpentiformis]AVV53778.1 site-specific integrase [Tannerella serpentiformis]
MDDMKMKVLLYLKKGTLDRSGKAPIMGRITLGRSIAQFSCKLFCNPDLWNPRESRMDGKSREAVEVNAKLDNLLLAVQASYQSLLAKGSPFDATDIKEHFQGCVQSRAMLLERFDDLIKEMEEHVGIDIKENSLVSYRQTRAQLHRFIRAKHNVSDLAFSQLTEDFIQQFEQYVTGEVGLKQSTCYNMIVLIKKVCKLTYREGAADTLLFDNVHIDKGDSRLPKALDKDALDKLKALRFDGLDGDMKTSRDVFLFACYTGAAYCDLMALNREHLIRDDEGALWLKFNRQKTGVLCRVKLLPEALRLLKQLHSDARETLLPYMNYATYLSCLKAISLRAGLSLTITTHTARHTFATLVTLEQGVPIETVSKMLGHSTVRMTERYAKVTPQKLFEEFDRLIAFTEDLHLTI